MEGTACRDASRRRWGCAGPCCGHLTCPGDSVPCSPHGLLVAQNGHNLAFTTGTIRSVNTHKLILLWRLFDCVVGLVISDEDATFENSEFQWLFAPILLAAKVARWLLPSMRALRG